MDREGGRINLLNQQVAAGDAAATAFSAGVATPLQG
jgi:hypothetical protein